MARTNIPVKAHILNTPIDTSLNESEQVTVDSGMGTAGGYITADRVGTGKLWLEIVNTNSGDDMIVTVLKGSSYLDASDPGAAWMASKGDLEITVPKIDSGVRGRQSVFLETARFIQNNGQIWLDFASDGTLAGQVIARSTPS